MEQQHLILAKKQFMKTTYLKTLTIIFCLVLYSCQAQQIYPLLTDTSNLPNNSYVKDLDNEYNSFEGTWKSNLNDRIVTLKITKVLQKPLQKLNISYYLDVLIVQYSIQDNNGNIIENNISSNLNDYKIISTVYSKKAQVAKLYYEGGKCQVGWGGISLKMIDSAHLKWNYQPESTVITNKNCPDYPAGGIKINLPDEPADIIFTKQ
ncbi:hypothetical protein ACM39_00390 [Chryseobacterium sp. FH2]|uniref:DUF6705 family protein n=1 Tax=Chryseobacterium sp. FH2 TaxID=1674291 RepID=UPI00065ABE24|nr:DUF6705 family protein [Chryseobacterium sp. FH2]KMQ69560.1 hypothetical protein ACM39_00390 [Chryseobacterium sp. FH2]